MTATTDPRRWTNLRGLARALLASPAPRPIPPWWSYEDLAGRPAITQAPELLGAAVNDTAPLEDHDAG